MSSSNWNSAARDIDNPGTGGTVAGYFASGDDALSAIDDLLEEGFSSGEIGAAFHGSSSARSSSSLSARESARLVNDLPIRSAKKLDTTAGGPTSDDSSITPMGLSTGGGTIIAGAGAPGPIPGSDIPPDLPKVIPSELPSDADTRTTSSSQFLRQAPTGDAPATGGFHELEQPGWWEKLKHVFGGSETDAASRRQPVSDKSNLKFGTGEGHLGTYADRDYAYSGSAFESSFSGMGIPQQHAQRLSRELQRGGAVITVRAGARNRTAEAIMDRNNGIIRYESASRAGESARENEKPDTRVEVFGEIHRVYPDYVRSSDTRERKVS